MRLAAGALALEAADLLSSPDPDLGDGVGYQALARWVYGDGLVSPADLEQLRLKLQTGLQKGLGDTSGDSAYGRSFSALGLSILAAADPKLTPALLSLTRRKDFDAKPFDAWLASLAAEKTALWKNGAAIDPTAFVPVRAQKQGLVHLAALLAREETPPEAFRKALNGALGKLAG